MLQVLNKHLKPTLEVITSIGYRNIAPLYCDEEMRICVKKKKQIDTGHSWDVWIEGPTGGMAVKAVARSIGRSADALPEASPKRVEDTARVALLDVQTVAAQAQNTLHALNREDAGKAQLSRVTREERRQLIRQVSSDSPVNSYSINPNDPKPTPSSTQVPSDWSEGSQSSTPKAHPETTPSSIQPPSDTSESSQTATSKPYLEFTPFSRQWRKQRIGKALRYLYMDWRSPLTNHATVERETAQKTAPLIALSPAAYRKDRRKEEKRSGETSGEELKVRKMGVYRIREIGTTAQVGVRAAERRRALEMAVSEGRRRREEREGRADDE